MNFDHDRYARPVIRPQGGIAPPSMASLGVGIPAARGETTEVIPPRALTTPPLVGRQGRKAVYSKRFKQAHHMMISEDLKETLTRLRIPADAALEDTIRRLAGLPERELL